jgi:hypothetical protein
MSGACADHGCARSLLHQGPPMKPALLPAVLAVLGAIAAPALAQDAAQIDGTALSKVKPARLIAFDGAQEFLKESSRLRVWRGEIDYTLRVDSTGRPSGCELAHKFRQTYVNVKLCEVLMQHHSFEPALDASGAAVDGSFEGHLSYMEMREKK